MKKPILPSVGVLGLVPDYWGGPWQVRHQVLTRLSKYFHVVWLNRPLNWQDYWLPNCKTPKISIPKTCGNMTIYNPGKWLPQLYRPRYMSEIIERLRLKQAIKILHRKGCEKILLYIWRPEFGSALEIVGHDLSFYHIDDEYTFSPSELPVPPDEHFLIKKVDQVFIHSPSMMEKKGQLNSKTLYVANGVDFQAFATCRAEPADMKDIPHPRIGYMGVIKDKINFPLIFDLATRHAEWSFVFVGPIGNLGSFESIVNDLHKLKNVYFLGNKSVESLPGYVQFFDVCMLCYLINDYTKYIFPLKVNEYLATGRPVVGVPIPSVELFRNVVRLANTSKEWSQAIVTSLSVDDNSASMVVARQQVAKQYDWNNQVYKIAKTMCVRLGKKHESILQSLSELR